MPQGASAAAGTSARQSLLVLAALAVWAVSTIASGVSPARSWRSDVPFLDRVWSAPILLDASSGGEVVLDPPFVRDGARYDLLVVGPAPGEILLTTGEGADEPVNREPGPGAGGVPAALPGEDESGLRLRVLSGVVAGATSEVRVREGEPDGVVIVRWRGFFDSDGRSLTFEAVLDTDGGIRAQYLHVPHLSVLSIPARAEPVSADPVLLSAGTDPVRPGEEGFSPRSGGVVLFPPSSGGGDTDAAVGCGVDDPWCSVAETRSLECTAGGRNGGVWTPCSTTSERIWHFNENQWCWSCPYTFYIVVECGQEMHLPFFDMEGLVMTITDVFTGVQLELEGINQCARVPFQYCNNCVGLFGRSISRQDQGCDPGAPLIPCEPFLQTSSRIAWGTPLQDTDGDGVGDSLPCGPPNTNSCPLGATGSNPAHEQTVTDVVLKGKPGLCGVFRLDITSGGFDWYLFANCTGLDQGRFDIYSRCEDALNAFDALPELVITDFSYSGVCPDINLEVEVTNIGCVDAATSPLRIQFDRPSQGDILTDLGPVPVSTSVVSSIPVNLSRTPMTATATVDYADQIFECSEDTTGGSTSCSPQTGWDSATRVLCQCQNNARAAVADDRVVSCGGRSVRVDAGVSTVQPCPASQVMYRFHKGDGTILQGWSPTPTLDVTPALCPSLVDYYVEVGCSGELLPECVDTVPFQVECAPEPIVSPRASDNDVCAGTTVSIDAGPGFATYNWSTGERTRSIEVSPQADTVYTVDVVNGKGCPGQGQVEVRVLPDPIPLALGNVLRVRRRDQDVFFDFTQLPGTYGPYELASVLPASCPSPPSPSPTPFVFTTVPVLDSGQPPLVHTGGIAACPYLLYYKVRGTSSCSGTPGPYCDGFPAQVLPCP